MTPVAKYRLFIGVLYCICIVVSIDGGNTYAAGCMAVVWLVVDACIRTVSKSKELM